MTSGLSVGLQTGYQARGSTQEQLKITHIDFAVLNSRVTVFIFKIFIFMMP